jgi:hypothetical protein
MSPNGRSVGTARYPYWTARIRPFYDSDEEREIFFYATDPLAQGVRTAFGATFWLARECHYWDALGTVIGSEKVFEGGAHETTVGNPIGDPDWLVHGISRARLLAGDYGPGVPRCGMVPTTAEVGRHTVEVIREFGPDVAQVGIIVVEIVGVP